MGDKGEQPFLEVVSSPRKSWQLLLIVLADRAKSIFPEPEVGEQIAKRASSSLPLKLSDDPSNIIFTRRNITTLLLRESGGNPLGNTYQEGQT